MLLGITNSILIMKHDIRQKPQTVRTIKISISLPNVIFDHAKDRTRQQGFTAVSGYIQDLVRKDGFLKVA